MELKRMNAVFPGRGPGRKRLTIERLCRQGLAPKEIARRVGATPGYVSLVAHNLRKRGHA
jgi:hypothetical protein